MARARPRRRLPRNGISTRLVALVLVPLAVLTAVGGYVVGGSRRAAHEASVIEDLVPEASRLALLSHAVQVEQASVQVLLRAERLGFAPGLALDLLGDAFEPLSARRATDAALEEVLDADGELPGVVAQLDEVRAAVDADTITPEDADRRYLELSDELFDSLSELAASIRDRATHIVSGEDVAESLEALVAIVEASYARATQFNSVAPLVLGAPSDQLRARAALSGADQLLTEALRELANSDPTLARAWRDTQRVENIDVVDHALALVAGGEPVEGQLDIPDLLDLARDGGELSAAAEALLVNAGALAEGTASELQAASVERYQATVLAVIAAFVVTLLLALWLGRGIAGPLLDLSEHAAAITEGDLDVPPLRQRGPRAARVVASAFNDLVDNLRLLETKSQALANCDFDNEVLDEPLPGRLGQSIQASITMLSGSIEERDQLQRRLAHQATHDALTGLQNRAAAIVSIEDALARARRASEPVSLLFADLDGFKLINDTHGHDVGDLVLREVANRMRGAVRDGDVVARLGGDEFLVLAERASDVDATVLARRIVEAVGEPILAGGRQLGVAASVGIALSLDGIGEPVDLLQRADLALYRAKARGRACVELYDESLQRELLRRAEVEEGLAATLAAGGDEFVLHYQPVVDASTGNVRAVEALIRWDRPGRGRVAPDDFIPVAESSDLIIDLDAWVLATATSHAAGWPTDGPISSTTAVSVNVSGRHLLSERLCGHVRDALDASGLDPRRLILEITETVLLTDLPGAAAQLDALRELGVRIAVDDFGTGYTSLAALQGLPIDTIKVDRSFVMSIHESRPRSLVALVTQLGQQLGVTVVAEGVETEEQLSTLQSLGCDEVQGFLISRPVPEHELHGAVAARAS